MTDPTLRRWAASTLKNALNQIPALLEGPDSATPEYQAWESSVKRALHAGFGDSSAFVSQFDGLTFVSAASVGTTGQPGSWQRFEERKTPHEILRVSTRLLREAVEALADVGESLPPAPASDGSWPADFHATEPTTTAEGGESVPVAFVSYAWENRAHQDWVLDDLATRLRHSGVKARLDRWELRLGYELTAFMESAVRESDYVLVVCTPAYKKKSDARTGGVGYESSVMTAERFVGGKAPGKFIPVIRSGSEATSIPTWLSGRMYIDLSGTVGGEKYESQFAELINRLHGYDEVPPPVGKKPPRPAKRPPRVAEPTAMPQKAEKPERADDPNEPIRIIRVATEKLGQPRNDGTRGSALYAVPLELSRKPGSDWADLFVKTWDRPPRFTSMHRPVIAQVRASTSS